MADPHQLSDQEAARRRRLWLQERHAQARELVVLLLRYAPEVEVARVLDQLPAVTCTGWRGCSPTPAAASSPRTPRGQGRHPARADRPRRHRHVRDSVAAPTRARFGNLCHDSEKMLVRRRRTRCPPLAALPVGGFPRRWKGNRG
jgi:hypothetical protein